MSVREWRESGPPPAFEERSHRARAVVVDDDVLPVAFDAFYLATRNDVVRALTFTVGSVSLAQDATDEAMARAYQQWEQVGGFENPAGWVYRTGLNWARSWRRSAFRREQREKRVALDLTTAAPTVSGESDDLFRALDALSIEHRSVVVLRHYWDWSVSATAVALGISEGTVKSRNARALEQLRRVLHGSEA